MRMTDITDTYTSFPTEDDECNYFVADENIRVMEYRYKVYDWIECHMVNGTARVQWSSLHNEILGWPAQANGVRFKHESDAIMYKLSHGVL
jgi:hypothetical protein